MCVLISVDDTDMPDTIGTGRLVQNLCFEMEELKMGTCSAVSRHQLFVHDDIPYTSHNSAMCFEFHSLASSMSEIIEFIQQYLVRHAAKGSDPGFCLADPGCFQSDRLIEFGRQAKANVMTKKQAYTLASDLGVHLSEHGGTGQGIIGALAGAGLRLSGNDGRYRGWYCLGKPGEVFRAGDLCGQSFIDVVVTPDGDVIDPDTRITIGSEKTKTVRLGSRQVVVVTQDPDQTGKTAFRTITKKEARAY